MKRNFYIYLFLFVFVVSKQGFAIPKLIPIEKPDTEDIIKNNSDNTKSNNKIIRNEIKTTKKQNTNIDSGVENKSINSNQNVIKQNNNNSKVKDTNKNIGDNNDLSVVKSNTDKYDNTKIKQEVSALTKNENIVKNNNNSGSSNKNQNDDNRMKYQKEIKQLEEKVNVDKKELNQNKIENNGRATKVIRSLEDNTQDRVNNNIRMLPEKNIKSNYYVTNSSNLNLISKIEQNLMYKDTLKANSSIEIKKGEWKKDDLMETDTTKFEIKRTSKKIKAESKENETDIRIAKLKDLAFEATKLKEYEIAVKLYKEILKLNPKDNFAKLSLATSYHILGQYVQAKPIYIELLPVFPKSEQLVSNLLSIIIQESPYEAIYLLPSLAERYSNSAKIQAQTSMAFAAVDRYDGAIKYIQNAINLDGDNNEYKYNLAVFYDMSKKYRNAYDLYRELYEISKVDKNLPGKKIKERLTQIKKHL